MLDLDGSDAGGGFLRSALALSALTGRAVRVEGVRGNRPEPGLGPQHHTALRVAAAACDADATGDEAGSESVTFDPGEPRGGEFAADVGTAGSVTLVFDTLLPVALRLGAPLRVCVTGGTDVAWSPTMPFYRRVKLPLLRALGVGAAVDVDRRGFYPAGGGTATLSLFPSSPSRLGLADRGGAADTRVFSAATGDLADADVAERQAAAATERLEAAGRTVAGRSVARVEADSPGSVCCVRADYGRSVAGFDALGEPGTPAGDVGREAADAAVAFDEGDAAVDRHLADQLLIVLAFAGGRLRIPEVTDHVRSTLDLLSAFGLAVALEDGPGHPLLVAPGRGIPG